MDIDKNRENVGLNNTSRTCYTLAAECKEEIKKWARCIQLYTDLVKGGDGTQIVSSDFHDKLSDDKITNGNIADQNGKTSPAWESQLERHMDVIKMLELGMGSQNPSVGNDDFECYENDHYLSDADDVENCYDHIGECSSQKEKNKIEA